jgi:hypothetical protein
VVLARIGWIALVQLDLVARVDAKLFAVVHPSPLFRPVAAALACAGPLRERRSFRPRG